MNKGAILPRIAEYFNSGYPAVRFKAITACAIPSGSALST